MFNKDLRPSVPRLEHEAKVTQLQNKVASLEELLQDIADAPGFNALPNLIREQIMLAIKEGEN